MMVMEQRRGVKREGEPMSQVRERGRSEGGGDGGVEEMGE